MKSGIVATECCRLLVTNKYSTTFQAQLNFFAQKLQDRGYPIRLIQSVFERYPWNKKAELLARRRFEKCAVVPLKLNWSPLLEHFGFSSIVRDNLHCLDSNIRKRLRIVMCFTSSANLFRLYYGRFAGAVS